MHNELRYQAKIQAISDMPKKEKEKNTISCNFLPNFLFLFLKKQKLKTCFMEIIS
jgi:hypothetical protein